MRLADRALAAGHTPSNTNTITNGNIEATVDGDQIVVKRVSDQALLFGSTNLSVAATEVADYFQWSLAVTSTADERFWGLGENMDGALNNKVGCLLLHSCECTSGCVHVCTRAPTVESPIKIVGVVCLLMCGVVELQGTNLDFRSNQVNTMITIPFTVSSKRYGLFFNSAAWGGIDMSQVCRQFPCPFSCLASFALSKLVSLVIHGRLCCFLKECRCHARQCSATRPRCPLR